LSGQKLLRAVLAPRLAELIVDQGGTAAGDRRGVCVECAELAMERKTRSI